MRKIKPRSEIEQAASIVKSVFPGSRVLDPEEAEAIVTGPAVTTAQVRQTEKQVLKVRVHEFTELSNAVDAMREHREALVAWAGGAISKRSYFVLQCARCEGLFVGTAGAKGWKYPSGRKGSCSVCAAGCTAKQVAVIVDEASVIYESGGA